MSELKVEEDLEWPVDRVRETFIEYFKTKDHTFWASSPCVPHDDPSLMFANAGMNQYKKIFLGTCDPNLDMSKLKRAVNSQKCIRAGGKHNDLDDVGKDVYHHTFFEMLGNWSFGDYFKKEAIAMAWECLTEVYKLNPERLYATYFGGDDSSPEDVEAKEFWLEYLPPERVLPFDAKDNFWEMGATGPCGPCTEIHYDRIGGRDASKQVNADLPDVIEIWNNVFIQYNREEDGSLRPLPHKHIDTGMGLERLTSILQNVDSNYDTDIFLPIFKALQDIVRKQGKKDIPTYAGKLGKDDEGGIDMAYRVIADHIRTLCFSIADGAVPSNDGRGYVLRRILRRAVRYGRSNMDADVGFFAKLVPTVVECFGGFFPELKDKQDFIYDIIQEEETSFGHTLDKGLIKFEQMASGATNGVFSGEDAHLLYTAMGFPVDLTELMAEEKGLTLDKAAYEAKMKEEADLSGKALKEKQLKASGGIDMSLEAEQTNYLVSEAKIAITDDEAKYERVPDFEATVLEVYVGRNATDKYGFIDAMSAEDSHDKPVAVILDKTNYYAESGGQVADSGTITSVDGSVVIEVESVQIYAGYIVHTGKLKSGTIKLRDSVKLNVDYDRRLKIESNHTLTHVLNYALRDVLVLNPGDEKKKGDQSLDQRGSLNDEFKLRFDFSWNAPLSASQLQRIEQICDERIKFAVPVEAFVASLPEAEKISTLRAVFGEAYPDPVRVVSVAPVPIQQMLDDPANPDWMGYSVEFCGGTHLRNTSEAENFVLVNEEGIAKGVRRITAVTRQLARDAIKAENVLQQKIDDAGSLEGLVLEAAKSSLTVEINETPISAAAKIKMRKTLDGYGKRVVQWKKAQATRYTATVLDTLVSEAAKTDEGVRFVVCSIDFAVDGKVAKSVMTAYGKKKECTKPYLFVAADSPANRFFVYAFAPKGCDPPIDCKAWVAAATAGIEAKGGGKEDNAQRNGPGVHNVEKVLEQARGYTP